MPALREPTLGPIVGHVSDTSARIWIRGSDSDDKGAELHSDRRTVGVATIFEVSGADRKLLLSDGGREDLREKLTKKAKEELGKTPPGKAAPKLYYFRLHREYDRTGTFCFGEDSCITGVPSPALKPDTDYVVLMGTLVVDDPFGDDRNVSSNRLAEKLPEPQVWAADLMDLKAATSLASFRTLNVIRCIFCDGPVNCGRRGEFCIREFETLCSRPLRTMRPRDDTAGHTLIGVNDASLRVEDQRAIDKVLRDDRGK